MIKDIIEEIKKVNQMIDLHSTSDGDFMLNQYQHLRDRLISELELETEKLMDFYYWKDWKNS